MNRQLFTEWINYSFLLEMDARCARFKYYGPALLLMDGFGLHHTEEVIDVLEQKNAVVVFIPRHTSDKLQP